MGKLKREERVLEQDGEWPALAALIAGGLGHELNGRVTSLLGIAFVARSTRRLEPDLLDDLEEEVQRLKRAAILLRRLPFFASSHPRPDRVADVVRDAIKLYDLGVGTPVTLTLDEPNGDSPQVWLASPDLAKALLLILAACARALPDTSREVRVLAPSTDTQSVCVESRGGVRALDIEVLSSLHEARQIIEGMGGTLVVVDDATGHRVTVTLPVASPPGPSSLPAR